jgi:hypothetical protein
MDFTPLPSFDMTPLPSFDMTPPPALVVPSSRDDWHKLCVRSSAVEIAGERNPDELSKLRALIADRKAARQRGKVFAALAGAGVKLDEPLSKIPPFSTVDSKDSTRLDRGTCYSPLPDQVSPAHLARLASGELARTTGSVGLVTAVEVCEFGPVPLGTAFTRGSLQDAVSKARASGIASAIDAAELRLETFERDEESDPVWYVVCVAPDEYYCCLMQPGLWIVTEIAAFTD